jgi:hypothetical protein
MILLLCSVLRAVGRSWSFLDLFYPARAVKRGFAWRDADEPVVSEP